MSKCFCHLSIDGESFEVKDAKARETKQDELTEFIVIGDSWSDLSVTDSIWSTRVAHVLGLNLTNYAKSGAGFVKPENNLISTQLNNFITSDIDKTKVKYIVLLGGINDYRNSVSEPDLRNAINNTVYSLQTQCPQAKILFVSNCQYPYTKTQSSYWKGLHDNLSTSLSIATYNLDGNIGEPLYNNANYFHLTQPGQKWMAKNIVCALTGGEITRFIDSRTFTNDKCKITYTVEKISTNMSLVQIILKTITADTSYSVSLSGTPNLSYGSGLGVYGTVSWMYANLICDCDNSTINIVSSKTLDAGKEYIIDMIITY